MLFPSGESSGSLNPKGSDIILFREITGNSNPRGGKFLGSVSIHLAVLGLLFLAAPRLFLNGVALLHATATLIAPVEPAPLSKHVLLRASPVVQTMAIAIAQRSLPPVPLPVKPRIPRPNLEEAPILPNSPKPPRVLSLPQEPPVINPPVQTGLFASNLPPKASPQLPVASGQSAGFDVAATRGAKVPEVQAAAAGFDTASPNPRPALAGATVQTGAFGQAFGGQPGAARLTGAKVGGTGFDTRPATIQPPASEQAVRKSGFDELKPVNPPLKAATPAGNPVHPVEILDKPKPAYTDEARQRKIEGDVVLDVIFTANCEVRVLRVVQGLGYGLDENAISAARHIRFTPASQSGSPVDQRVTIRVVFQITQ
jgi:TonB family protein